ncbi:MAG: hypothetical protein MJ233_04130 [Mycoplasmoidaceae bacterium]|nr:hypothetical protein [Mycoplasmoidaceae bacterium]
MTPTLSSTEYYDQGNKKVYVKVLFSGQTITADSNCSFDLTIGNKAVAAD